ncbi:enoyl-CoA delta isomerase 2: mitochondrial-like isoform X4, partial [Dinothrombium tinctorium]
LSIAKHLLELQQQVMSRILIESVPLFRNTFFKSSTVRYFSSAIEDEFKQAIDKSTKLKQDPGNEAKLDLYALYKQATVGPCNAPKPGTFDFVGKYKWEAWNKLGSMAKDEAKQQYIATVNKLVVEVGLNADQSATSSTSSEQSSNDDSLIFTQREGVLTIRVNRPKRYNAMMSDMYKAITEKLNDAAKDDSVKLVVLTGTGEYYSSGNDLTAFGKVKQEDIPRLLDVNKQILQNFVGIFIDFPKPLIAAVNGPAIGIMVTTLALCDVVVCSDTATFKTPFSATAQSPEGCSSILFPQILGISKANQMLMFNETLTAQEALNTGFVAKIFPKDSFDKSIEEMIFGETGIIKTCAQGSLLASKSLIRNEEFKNKLHQANKIECDTLTKRWLSEEFVQAITKFLLRKKK